MTIEAVKAYFAPLGRQQDILEFSISSATVELAAQAVGVIPARIAKTLSFQGPAGCILVVTAGDAKIENKKYKAQFGIKAKMLTPEDVLMYTGHAIGGVCPFGVARGDVAVYCDISLQRFETVFPACGSDHSAIELTCGELYSLAQGVAWVDVCKDWQPLTKER